MDLGGWLRSLGLGQYRELYQPELRNPIPRRGNPFSVKEYGHGHAVALHRAWLFGRSIGIDLPNELLQRRKAVLEALPALRGNLACWRPLPERGEPDNCHAALLLELAKG
jgi:hypothetical protein